MQISSPTHILYGVLRGSGALIEGVEFLITNRRMTLKLARHFAAAAACTYGAGLMAPALASWLPVPVPLSLPWYLVLVEWAWTGIPWALTSAYTAWIASVLYLGIVSVSAPDAKVSALRNRQSRPSHSFRPRYWASLSLIAGGGLCWIAMWIPWVGTLCALALFCPILGSGFVVATLAQHGWSTANAVSYLRSRIATLSGLGGAVIATVAVPGLGLAALAIAATGTSCFVARDERDGLLRTSAETAPCASRGK